MPTPYVPHTWGPGTTPEVVSNAKMNNIDNGIQDLYGLILNQSTTLTYTGRRLTQASWVDGKAVINWASGGNGKIASIQIYDPISILLWTYTPTYAGRKVSIWTRS